MILNLIVSLIKPKRNPASNGYITIVYDKDRQPHLVYDSLSILGSQYVPSLTPKNHEINRPAQNSVKENYFYANSEPKVKQWSTSEILINPATGLVMANGANIDVNGNPIGHEDWEPANDQTFYDPIDIFE